MHIQEFQSPGPVCCQGPGNKNHRQARHPLGCNGTQEMLLLPLLAMLLALATVHPTSFADVVVKTEQLNPATPEWKFKSIPRPSKSDVATGCTVALVGSQFEPAAADGSVLVNGAVPEDSLDLTEAALLTNGDASNGSLVIDLVRVQPIAAITSYSWHEWDVDQGSRGPQVFTLYGSAATKPDPANLGTWTKIADVDTRPNNTGVGWNGQHGVCVSDTSGKLGDFRHLLFALRRTLSPLQPNPNMTATLFSEIDVHTSETLPKAGDAVAATPASVPIEHVWVVFKTHLDIGYTDRIEAVLKKYRVNMMEDALKVIEASRALPAAQRFSWTLAGWPLSYVLGAAQDPARRTRIEQAVREGAIAFHALPFTTHTETQDLEDLVRGMGFSTRLSRQFQRPLPISAKMTDVPSHSWIMPTMLAHAGVRFLQIGCNGTSAFIRVPRLFWWEGPDSSRILCNYTPDYGSGLRAPRGWPSKHYLAMEMTGDNHGPPTPVEVERLRQQAASTLPGVQIHFGTLDDFAKAVLAENPTLQVIRADMPDTWIHGWLSMPIEAKAARGFRALEPALDGLDTQLHAWGVPTEPLAQALAESYEQSALFSEHTFGPWGPNGGSWNSGTPRYLYGAEWKAAYERGAYRKYEEAFDDKRAFAHRAETIVHKELADRLEVLARSIKTKDEHVVVYNALPWERSGSVALPGDPNRTLYAKQIPPNGYRAYAISDFQLSSGEEPRKANATELKTRHFRINFDLERGGIASLVDRRTGRELVDKGSPYVLGQFLHERFDEQRMQRFHKAYGRPGYSWPKGDLPKGATYAAITPREWKLTVQTTPPVDLAILTAGDTVGLGKDVQIQFAFDRREPSIEVTWHVTDKVPDPMPEGGWLCFPFAVQQPSFLLGRLGGPIDPLKDIAPGANRHYFTLNGGLTITGTDGNGFGLCPLDSPCVSLDKPGLWEFSLDYKPEKPSVFVNLYNNEWNTNFPEWQGGSWSSRVRIWLNSKGTDSAHSLTVPSWEARLPLLAAKTGSGTGPLPKTQAGLSLSRPGILVTAFGQNPDGEGTLLRLWEQAGQSGMCKVRLPAGLGLPATNVQPVNLRGQAEGAPIPVKGRVFETAVRPYAPASFLIQTR